MSAFKKAVKHESKLRLAISGPSGSGKTYTALRLATGLGSKVAFIDTERGSASKYADEFDFDVLEVRPPYHPDRFLAAIACAEKEGYEVCIIDSLSHAWNGQGGVLEVVDQEALKSKGNSYVAWAKGTPLQNKFIDGLTSANLHIIGTMRSKTDYILEQNSNGKTTPRKVGMAPIQREGFEYEFDISLEMTLDNDAIVQKTRCSSISGKVFEKPGDDLAAIIKAWLQGEPVRQKAQESPQGQRFLALAKAQFGQNKADLVQWIAAQFEGKTFGQLTAAEMGAAADLLASVQPANDDPDQADHDHEQRRFFAVLKERGLTDQYEGAVTWWAGRDCGWPTGAKGRPSMSLAPANLVRLASQMLTDFTQDDLDQILDDYRCSQIDNTPQDKD